MCLIVVSGRSFSGAELLARRVSEELGYRWIEEEAVIERAASWGIPPEQLRAVAGPTANPKRGLLEGAGVELLALRAALAEEAASSDAALTGDLGFLLPRHVAPVLRIRLSVPVECRITVLREQLRLTNAEAVRRIRRADRAYCRSVRKLSGSEDEDPGLYDLVVNAPKGDLASACGTIAAFVRRQTSFETEREYRRAIADFALAARIEALLRIVPHTAHVNATVRADGGLVFVAATHWSARDRIAIDNVVSLISGARRLVLVELRPGANLHGPPLRNRIRAAWPSWAAGAAAWGLLVASCVFLMHFEARTIPNTSLRGVITDTRCAGHHRVSADSDTVRCVRECIKLQDHIKYALFDGAHIYALDDQGLGDRFAAHAVTITGRLDRKTNVIEVRSIKLTSGTRESLSF